MGGSSLHYAVKAFDSCRTSSRRFEMFGNRRRQDAYRNFNFRAMIGAVLAGFAAWGIVKKLIPGSSIKSSRKSNSGFNEIHSGSRPIEGVGTSTAGFIGTTPEPKSVSHSHPTRIRNRGVSRRKKAGA